MYLMNNANDYIPSEYVKHNVYLTMEPNDDPLPTYEENKDRLPKPIWDGHDSTLACYDYAWKTAFGNLRKANKEANFVSDFIDTAFNDNLFMWDSSFIVMFGKYGSHVFDFQKTLDNFYSHQHRDGFICREICELEPGERFSRFDPCATGPNIMPWSEWESYCQTGDKDRIARIFDPLLGYHLWLKQNHTWIDGTYWSSGWGCGMDDQPRTEPGQNVSHAHGFMAWIDTCIQAVLSGKTLVKMAEVLGRTDDPGILEIQEEIAHLTDILNNEMWDDQIAFYFDRFRSGKLSTLKSIGAYWALLADIVPEDRLDRFVAHLDNPAEFNRPHRIPTMSADHPQYGPNGWSGAVWAPTNYMVLKGLERYGYNELSYDIACNNVENVVKVFEDTGTLWENYDPEKPAQGTIAAKNFVGWSGLYPISILFEYVFGIRPKAERGLIEWHVRRTERHGITRYPFGDAEVDLLCEARASEDEEPQITVKSTLPVKVEVHWKGTVKIIESRD
jgi:hypothetical protein